MTKYNIPKDSHALFQGIIMGRYFHFLKNVKFFQSLCDKDIHEIEAVCKKQVFEPDRIIFLEGTLGSHFYIILKGNVEIIKDYTRQDKDSLIILKQEQSFGELALIDNFPRSATAVTRSETVLLSISRNDFHNVIKGSAPISFSIMKSLSYMIRERTESFIDDLRQRNLNLETAYAQLKQEIEERRQAEKKLHHQAFHDSLTNLPNRAYFLDHLQDVMEKAKNKKMFYAVLYLDIDRFNVINESFGHIIGDEVLVRISGRLKNCIRRSEILARFGGDEFAVLLEGIKQPEDASVVAKRIQEALEHPLLIQGKEIFITASIGIVTSRHKYQSTVEILRDADVAMYGAKAKGLAEYQFYDEVLHEKTMDMLRLETDLRKGVERGEFVLEYQPIVSLQTCEIAGFETLVRWQHPERGIISPEIFIPIAEKTGSIIKLGDWILYEGCCQMKQWLEKIPANRQLFININVSGKQFIQPDFIAKFKETLSQTGLPGSYLKIEMTESVLMKNVDQLNNILSQIKALGVRIALDDFGTGYSSLSYLHKFPIDVLKIDRSFVVQMGARNEKDLVSIIISIAKNMKMDVVAEGIETAAQFKRLHSYDCQYGQGFLFSKPLRTKEAENLIMGTDIKLSFCRELIDIIT
ncbi:GGDEF and cyclic nucleotide-binding EAL domains-containing protein [Desulfonema limicola]|uniref:GGDEF and cyclic nucleotide-binding EAL domains-containing protein n=1 Tax=Desulfonema limicola TaxID=45656 RepID=A0A975B6Z0_9BACT|nr:EAL domain-containing protein [Desulfonema limicola]QTA79987.1 GGDEF and cyclic nucleotide-binding EAL domains-containing protein [Desulfonema limicola]